MPWAGCVGVGAQHCPLCLHALWGLRAAGEVGGRPRGGGGLPLLREASGVRRCPSPGRRSSGAGSLGSATRVSRVRLVWAWGPSTGPTARALAGRHCERWGWRRGVPGGGALHRREGRLGSGAPPPPAARPLGGLSGSATHVLWARVCGRGGPAPAPWPACPVGGCAPRGWRGASWFRRPLFPAARPLGGLPGPAGRVPWVRVWVCGVCVVPVRCVPWCWVLPFACLSGASLWCPPLWCFVAVLRSPCACRATLPARAPCSSAGYLPFLSWLRCSLPFPLPFVGSPSSLACTFSLPSPWCVSRSFPLPASLAPVAAPSSFSPVGSCETEGGLRRVGRLGD